MISLYIAFLRWRAKRHADRAQIFGLAVLAAQQRRDFTGAAYFWEQLEKARTKRDLLSLRASSLATRSDRGCEHCNCNCNQGRWCPSRQPR